MFGGAAIAAAHQAQPAIEEQEASDKQSLWEDMEVLSGLAESTVRELYSGRTGKLRFGAVVNSDAGVVGEVLAIGNGTAEIKALIAPKSQFAPSAAYLPGYGVVLQMELPPLRPATVSTTDEPTVCPFMSKSPWAREKERLRGAWRIQDCRSCHSAYKQTLTQMNELLTRAIVVPDTADTRQAPTRDQLVDRLLKLLADNGHHVRWLDSGESIAIAVEFRDKQTPLDSWPLAAAAGVSDGSDAAARWDFIGPSVGKQEEDEGDLFLRQGNHKSALEAYQNALDQLKGFSHGALQANETSNVKRLLKKQAQAQLGAGDLDGARAAMDKLARLEQQKADAPDPAETPNLHFPPRLVVRAPVDALRKVGTGMMTFEKFRDSVDVTYFEPKAAGDSSQPPADNSESTGNDDSAEKK
jgi:hypothetical protein